MERMTTLETGSRSSGFTLVELVIVLSVLALLTSAAVPSVKGVLNERDARVPVLELEMLTREVRNRALAEQRPYQIVFDSDGFRASRYFNPYGGKEEFEKLATELKMHQDRMEIIEASRERGMSEIEKVDPRFEAALAGLTYSAAYQLPHQINYRMKFWRDSDWISMESGEFRRWVFQPSGMCEPMKIQFQSDNAFFEVEFHPLTAAIKSETSWVE